MSAQSLNALTFANEVRLAQADLRKELASLTQIQARRRFARTIRCPEGVEERFQVEQVMRSIPGVGPGRVAKGMLRLGRRNGGVRVGELTDRERGVLAAWLEEM